MKKMISSCVVIAVLSLVAIFATQSFSPAELTSTQLANIEALASGETNQKKKCFNTITADESSKVRYCPICDFISGDDPWYAISSTCK